MSKLSFNHYFVRLCRGHIIICRWRYMRRHTI